MDPHTQSRPTFLINPLHHASEVAYVVPPILPADTWIPDFTKGTVGEVFGLPKKGQMGVSSHSSPFLLPFPLTPPPPNSGSCSYRVHPDRLMIPHVPPNPPLPHSPHSPPFFHRRLGV